MSNEEYMHRAEWFKEGIIEKHYGLDLIKEPFASKDDILIHRGNVKMDLDDHTTDAAGYILGGSPHLPFDKPAVKRAEDVHKNIMDLKP